MHLRTGRCDTITPIGARRPALRARQPRHGFVECAPPDAHCPRSGWTVHFKLRNADVEQNNVKGTKRFFVPRVADVAVDAAKHTLSTAASRRRHPAMSRV